MFRIRRGDACAPASAKWDDFVECFTRLTLRQSRYRGGV